MPKRRKAAPPLSPVAKHLAWYKETLPFHAACDPTTLGTEDPRRLLANRLESAFLAGLAAGERIAAERVADHFKRIAANRELPLCPL